MAKTTPDIAITALDEKKKLLLFNRKKLSEIDNLENSEYELKRIHQEFYTQHELDSTQTKFNKERIAFFQNRILKTEIPTKIAIKRQ